MISSNSIYSYLPQLEKDMGYSFKNKENILLALTHSSYSNELKDRKLSSNERLEFLGDSILNFIISKFMYLNLPNLAEGDMTRIRALIVCESSLAQCASKIKIGNYLLLSNGEYLTGGKSRPSILSDSFEAIIGAIYIDSDINSCEKFVLEQMSELINNCINGSIFLDYKTKLQEIVQQTQKGTKIEYSIIDESGPNHNKLFVSQIKIGDTIWGIGKGKTKKESEQIAAKKTIDLLKSGN